MLSKKRNEDAVSPVVGVMLMLVVTIVIAATVSGFAGGLVKGEGTAPLATVDVSIKNSGNWKGSYIQFDVKSVDRPFSSGDLKIVTSWTNKTGTVGGSTVTMGLNVGYYDNVDYIAPLGFGSTLSNWSASAPFTPEQDFGNYTISGGTTMKATPYGNATEAEGYGVVTPFEYTGLDYDDTDAMRALLGANWYTLRAGDSVKVVILDIPSGKAIYNNEVKVVE